MLIESSKTGAPIVIMALVVDDFGNLLNLNDITPAKTFYQAFDAAASFTQQAH